MNNNWKVVFTSFIVLPLFVSCWWPPESPPEYFIEMSIVNDSKHDIYVETNFPRGLDAYHVDFYAERDSRPAQLYAYPGQSRVIFLDGFTEDFDPKEWLFSHFPEGEIYIYEFVHETEGWHKGDWITTLHIDSISIEQYIGSYDKVKYYYLSIHYNPDKNK